MEEYQGKAYPLDSRDYTTGALDQLERINTYLLTPNPDIEVLRTATAKKIQILKRYLQQNGKS